MGRIALAFLAGHCCVHVLPRLPDASFVVVLLIAVSLAVVLRAKHLAVFALGIAWSWGHAAVRLADDLPAALEGQDVLIQGYIASLPDRGEREVRFVFDVTRSAPEIPRRVQLAWYDVSRTPNVGESWQLLVRLKRRNGFANPGGFDYEAHLFRAAIGATGYVRSDDRNQRLEAAKARYAIDQARAWIAERMASAVEDLSMIGVLQGLAVGDTRRMTNEQWAVFSATGTTHLMAISGLHITMLAAIAAWLGGAIVRWPTAQARGWCAIHGRVIAGSTAAIGYSLLAGLSVPTQRTAIMLCVYFVARWWRRELAIGHALALALIAVLLIDPFAPLSVGAWLSFGAVGILVLALSGRLRRDSPTKSFGRAQLAMTLGLLPLLLGAFGSISLVAPFANAAAIPVFTFVVVPLVLLGAALATVSTALAAVSLDLATLVLGLLFAPLEWFASQPFAMWHFPSATPLSFAALCVGSLALIVPAVWPIRLLGVVLCAHVFLISSPSPEPGDFDLAVLDVGQGLATVVRTQNHALVYDAGPAFESGRDAAALAVLPYLRTKGIRRIDTLVVSHGDLDHRGGLPALLDGIPVGRLVVGQSVQQPPKRRIELCLHGQVWTWDDVTFEVLHPGADFHGSDNDTSCVVRVSGRAGTVLLTGDIEAEAESALLRRSLASHVDVAVIPHHGSRTSSSEAFVDRLAPGIAIASAGYRNRWGLPKPDVMQRWTERGAHTSSTAQSGAIEVSIALNAPIRVREHRRASRRYWTRPTAD